ncbi:MAG TPA: group 1 truncated hemoglobin [Acidimicrobiales bacterium]
MPSLYERLGGEDGIALLVDEFYDGVVADPLLKPIFEKARMDHLRTMQREFIATATGGPTSYSGLSLQDAHRNRAIGEAHFAAFARHLIEALKAHGADDDDLADVAHRLSLWRDDVMGVATDGD